MKNETELLRRRQISETLKQKFLTGELVAWNKGLKMPEEYCQKLSDYWKIHNKPGRIAKGNSPWNKGLKGFMAGEKHYNWKGGISSWYIKMYGSARYKNWRNKVFKRDKYTCQVCGEIGRKLEAHHIKSFKLFPKSRFTISNGVTLCRECHKRHHNLYGKTLKNFANSENPFYGQRRTKFTEDRTPSVINA